MQQGVRILAIAAVFALFPAVTMSVAADRLAHDDQALRSGPTRPAWPAAILPRRQNGPQ